MFSKDEPLSTRVTRINNKWHCRLYLYSDVVDEDIGYCFRDMCRWYSKKGFLPKSLMAESSRLRGKNISSVGKIERVKVIYG